MPCDIDKNEIIRRNSSQKTTHLPGVLPGGARNTDTMPRQTAHTPAFCGCGRVLPGVANECHRASGTRSVHRESAFLEYTPLPLLSCFHHAWQGTDTMFRSHPETVSPG